MKTIEQLIDDLVSDTACCDRSGCRCWQAINDLEKIRDYCDREIRRSLHFNEEKQPESNPQREE